MTSPRQRKKRLAMLKLRQKQQKSNTEVNDTVAAVVVAPPPAPVVESVPATLKAKKSKVGLVELKTTDQVVEQKTEEVNTSTKE